jgi:hypothetical protein
MDAGLSILESWTIPPRAITETIETPAFALGFCFSVPSAKEATVPISLNNL